MNWKKLFGYVWALPLTLLGLVFVLPWAMVGTYRWKGVQGDALVWYYDWRRSPNWFWRLWRHWGAWTSGNVIVTRFNPGKPLASSTMRHAQAHVRQHMRLGIFYPVIYGLASLGLWVIGGYPYYDNPFEISARREARQYVDLVELLKKSKTSLHSRWNRV